MSRLRAVFKSILTWSTLRYGVSGTVVAAFSLGTPVLLNAAFGVALEEAIPIVYVVAVALQFSLQRFFVFRHVTRFALPVHRQILWYVVIVAVQYPTSALATAFLPSLLGVQARVVYVCAALCIACITFLFLRRNVFHAHDELELLIQPAHEPFAQAPEPTV